MYRCTSLKIQKPLCPQRSEYVSMVFANDENYQFASKINSDSVTLHCDVGNLFAKEIGKL